MISARVFVFAGMFFSSLLVFSWTVFRLYRFMRRGRPDIRWDFFGKRIKSVFVYWLAQKKVGEAVSYDAPRGVTSKHHYVIFAGFLIISVGSLELVVQGLFPKVTFSFLGPLYPVLTWSVDFFNGLVLMAILYAFVRRIVLRPRLLPFGLDAALVLTQIGLLMLTHFAFHAAREASSPPAHTFGPLVWGVSALLKGLSPFALLIVSEVSYWMHMSILFFFLNYLPYSKHIHVLGSLPNIFFRRFGKKGVMPKLDLEDETDWGVGKIEQFGQKSLMDLYACTECARCSNFCPAYNTDKPLSPMHLVLALRHEMIDRGKTMESLQKQKNRKDPDAQRQVSALEQRIAAMPALVGDRIKEETLWSCTTCGACEQVCPVLIEHPLKIQQMKTHLVLSEGRMPIEIQRTFQQLERSGNPWGLSSDRRMDWAEGLSVPLMDQNPGAEYVLFVGCAAAFDERLRASMRALVEILIMAEVSFAVFGKKEGCSGDPARRAGNEYLFQQQANHNISQFNAASVRKIITNCPHCFHTIQNEYPAFGGHYEVLHHTQLIAHLLQDGRLKVGGVLEQKITYHDSCYLGRWNQEYDAPRSVLKQMGSDGKVHELKRNREYGFCCGAGGGRMWQEEKTPRVNRNRADEIVASGADIAAVACPFCTIMLTDGVKEAGAENQVQILDVAQVVRKSLSMVKSQSLQLK